jgi:hypothetical protein
MLVHCFWVVNSNLCLNSFGCLLLKIWKPFSFSLFLLPRFWPVYIFGPSCRRPALPLLLFPLVAANPSAWPSSQQLLGLAAAQATPRTRRVRPQPALLSAQLRPIAHAPLPPAVADMWDPPVIPYLKPYPTVTPPPPPPESVPCTHSHA